MAATHIELQFFISNFLFQILVIATWITAITSCIDSFFFFFFYPGLCESPVPVPKEYIHFNNASQVLLYLFVFVCIASSSYSANVAGNESQIYNNHDRKNNHEQYSVFSDSDSTSVIVQPIWRISFSATALVRSYQVASAC